MTLPELDNLLTLAEAADQLGVAAVTLRHQVKNGQFEARLFGKTWITTRAEVDRYRDVHLGRVGRPRAESANSRLEAKSR